MIAVDVLGRVDELTDGTGGSVDAVMGTAVGPYRKSRLSGVGSSSHPLAGASLAAGDQTA